jgi:hypothetical protein
VLDAILGGDKIDDAVAAESTWKGILDDTMKPRGISELQHIDTERAKLPEFELDIKNELVRARALADTYLQKLPDLDTKLINDADWNVSQRDRELTLSDSTCVDDAIREVCKFVACGYTADYDGIATRARADAEVANIAAYREACDLANRYNTRVGAHTRMNIRLQTRSQFLLSSSVNRESERVSAWKMNEDMRFKHADKLESIRLGRRKLSVEYDQQADKIWADRWAVYYKLHNDHDTAANEMSKERWAAYSESALKSMREGGEMLAAAAQAYQFLAASIRASSKQGGMSIGGIAASLAAVLGVFNGSCEKSLLGVYSRPQNCCP